MHMPARALGEPIADQLCFVHAVVVHDDVNVEIGGHIAFDLVKEITELLRPMPGHAGRTYCGGLPPATRADWLCGSLANWRIMKKPAEPSPVVFVVDDDVSVREGLKSLLRSVDLRVEMFGSAAEFLESKLPDAPGCLVLDVRLPGLSGLDFQAELANAGIGIPIIFITGHGDIPMTVRAMKAGAVEFLTKPFREQDMLDAIPAHHRQIVR